MNWLPEWGDAANLTYSMILLFGQKGGADLDQAAIRSNLLEYEDQCAAAIEFIFRFQARQATAMLLFMNQLAPDERTPIREIGLQKARRHAAEIITGALISIAEGMKLENKRLITAALRDTCKVWVKFIPSDDRTQIKDKTAEILGLENDNDVRRCLTTFAEAIAMTK